MDEVAAFLQRQFPIVVDDQLAVMGKAYLRAARISPRSSGSLLSLTRNCTSLTPSGTMRSSHLALSKIG